ncbi:hypothetical protein GCM10025865_00580 [Paraoerskovia sediminicola]|uniref:Toxic anion resistance protein n=1 Tax=Paraoerskovia sediminicola TaxID=1138587 RepID=A0ABM8FYL6_9CELL|nr:toxic anion resistance protein [Paraoerskovia sediminicola]BDZ40759.1 hypothetical protein GCM10025865_00580 [Paraoerskovia sediminicola]
MLAAGASTRSTESLDALRRTITSLDPNEVQFRRKVLGIFPVGESLESYFRRYEAAQDQLDAVIRSLYDDQDALRRQNASLRLEQEATWRSMAGLNRTVHVLSRLDTGVSAEAARLDGVDPAGTEDLRAVVLPTVRRRHQDVLTRLAVAVQAYLALGLVVDTNQQLVQGIDRATTTTVAALRTAVVTAGAVAGRQLVLDRVAALDTALRAAGAAVEAGTSTGSGTGGRTGTDADVEALRRAFDGLRETIDEVGTFRDSAASVLGTTLGSLEAEVRRSGTSREGA